MELRILILFFLMLFVIFLNIYLYSSSKKENFVYISNIGSINITKENITFKESLILRNCTKDEDCAWIITNCCPENAGPRWECLNKNSYIDCESKLVLCANFSSSKPDKNCRCLENVCSE